MPNIATLFERQCRDAGLPFDTIESPLSYNNSTLFCPAGMQRYSPVFRDGGVAGKTIANIQTCIRLNDIDNAGDGTHSIVFRMLGLFSFRDWPLQRAVSFFHEFCNTCLVDVHHVTVHPDKFAEWGSVHPTGMTVKPDMDCTWSDGEIFGYCTEFYAIDINGNKVEIGNVVNPLGNCIDVGFGLERMDSIANGRPARTQLEELTAAAYAIIGSGIKPSNTQHGYVLRKILRRIDKFGGHVDHPFFTDERVKRAVIMDKYHRLLPKHHNKTPEWWWTTHGVDITS